MFSLMKISLLDFSCKISLNNKTLSKGSETCEEKVKNSEEKLNKKLNFEIFESCSKYLSLF